jgi:hypothetical protein
MAYAASGSNRNRRGRRRIINTETFAVIINKANLIIGKR